MNVLVRNGYGSHFNRLTIISDTIIKKESISPYGHVKLDNEKEFYKYINTNSIIFPVPKLIEYSDHWYSMEYLSNYIPLYKIYEMFDNYEKVNVYSSIKSKLTALHIQTQKIVLFDTISNDIEYECKTKLFERFKMIHSLIDTYSFIKSVNGLIIHSFTDSINIHYNRVVNYFNRKQKHELCVIHGDCQFNNILINKQSHDIIFIDPKASFGKTQLFGVPEYDFAKLKFAISGYDKFDNSEIETLDVTGDNLNITLSPLLENELNRVDVLTSMAILIWLGNAHCFINQPNKAVYSYFYGLYLAKRYE